MDEGEAIKKGFLSIESTTELLILNMWSVVRSVVGLSKVFAHVLRASPSSALCLRVAANGSASRR